MLRPGNNFLQFVTVKNLEDVAAAPLVDDRRDFSFESRKRHSLLAGGLGSDDHLLSERKFLQKLGDRRAVRRFLGQRFPRTVPESPRFPHHKLTWYVSL